MMTHGNPAILKKKFTLNSYKNKFACIADQKVLFARIVLAFVKTVLQENESIYGFTSLSRIFHLYRDVTIAGEGL
jgi:hypothetical protein